jgi:hypothetical protein
MIDHVPISAPSSEKDSERARTMQSSMESTPTKAEAIRNEMNIRKFIQSPFEINPESASLSLSSTIDVTKFPPDVETFQCEECNSIILMKDNQIHIDHHYAMKLQSELRSEDRQRREEESQRQNLHRKATGNKKSSKSVTSNAPHSKTLLSLWSKLPASK